MARNVKVLLTENVDNLGIVGDVVNVRTGYARNFLLPRRLATTPSEEAVAAIAAKRAEAERQLAELRKVREGMTTRMEGIEITLQRSCNDQGVLYAAVTQQDIAEALKTLGFDVKPREVRLAEAIKTIDSYQVTLKFDSDLLASIKVWVVADRKLEPVEAKPEIEINEHGEMIEPRKGRRADRAREDAAPSGEDKKARKPREDSKEAPDAKPKAAKARKA